MAVLVYFLQFAALFGVNSVLGDLCQSWGVVACCSLAFVLGWVYVYPGYLVAPRSERRAMVGVAIAWAAALGTAIGLVGVAALTQKPEPGWLVDPSTVSGVSTLAGLVMFLPEALGMFFGVRSLRYGS